jgi:hypothetical protein
MAVPPQVTVAVPTKDRRERMLRCLDAVLAPLAGGTIIAYTDSDCLPAPGWLSAAVPAFEDPESAS